MLLDRFSAGLDSIVVIGDLLDDIDEFYTVAKERDGYPCLKLERTERRPGGAGAVARMVRSFGVECILACDPFAVSVKRRLIADDRVLCRLDFDRVSTKWVDTPPAALVLVADYGKGVVTDSLLRRLARQYPGKEIIVDAHASRPEGFYQQAGNVTIKSSFGKADIQTQGVDGIIYRGDWFRSLCKEVDPCGAGDMVLATLGVARLRGMDWREACRWAAENAARVCEVWGAVAPETVTNSLQERYP